MDPLIKSQLLYQLSYTPIEKIAAPEKERRQFRDAACSKRRWACPAFHGLDEKKETVVQMFG